MHTTTSSSNVQRLGHAHVRTITPDTLLLRANCGERIFVVDVRDPSESDGGRRRFPGALRVPLHRLFVQRNEFPFGPRDTVVTVSNEGVRARAAAYTLLLLGYRNVLALEGGLDAWARKSLPFE